MIFHLKDKKNALLEITVPSPTIDEIERWLIFQSGYSNHDDGWEKITKKSEAPKGVRSVSSLRKGENVHINYKNGY